MRTLLAKDIAPFTKILAKMELKETIKGMFANAQNNEKGNMTSELIWGIIENYYKAEQDLFKFLADLEGKTTEDISNLSITEFSEIIKTLFSKENMPFLAFASK